MPVLRTLDTPGVGIEFKKCKGIFWTSDEWRFEITDVLQTRRPSLGFTSTILKLQVLMMVVCLSFFCSAQVWAVLQELGAPLAAAEATSFEMSLHSLGDRARVLGPLEVAPEGHDCPVRGTVLGLDVSDYNWGTRWNSVQKGGRAFAYIKATEGSNYANPLFSGDWVASKRAGIYRGAYHFFHPLSDPLRQAEFFLRKMGPLEADDLPPLFDWEVGDGMKVSTQIKRAKVWLEKVAEATGKTPVIYIDISFWRSLGQPEGFEKYPLFIADYAKCPAVPPPWKSWTFWQANIGPVQGVAGGKVDRDVFNGTLDDLNQLLSGR